MVVFFFKRVTNIVKIVSRWDFISRECKIIVMEDLPQSILKNDKRKRIATFPSINMLLNKVLEFPGEKDLSQCLEETICGKKY